jgi:hypothetical protein
VRGAAFLVLATSPGNFQAWVAIDNHDGVTDADFARRLRRGAGADPTASGATRVAGTNNYKLKYQPDFPVVRIDEANGARIVKRAALEALGLVAEPDAPRTPALRVSRRARGRWPSYEHTLARAPLAHNSDQKDVSKADLPGA